MKMGYPRKHILCWLLLILIINQTTSAADSSSTVNSSSVRYSSTTFNSTITSSGTTPSVVTTDTTTITATTIRPPLIGENCTNNTGCKWNNSGCQNNICRCNNDFFEVNNTACIRVPSIQMTVLHDNETTVMLNWSLLQEEVQNLISIGIIQLWVTVQGLDDNRLNNCTIINQTLSVANCTGLSPGVRYNFSVNLYHTKGYFGVQQHMIFIQRPAPPGPINRSGSVFTAPNVSLSWNASVGLVDYYSVIVKDSKENIVANVTSDNNQSQILISGLRHGRNYTVELVANRLNKPSHPREDNFTTTIIAPYSPVNVTVLETSITSSSLNLTWTKPSDFNGPRVGYIVCTLERIYPDENGVNKGCNETSEKWFQVTSLRAGAFYNFSVYSRNSVYNSSDPAVSEEKQTLEGSPGIVDDVKLVPSDNKIEVMWHRPKQPNGNIIAYKINASNMDNTSDCHIMLLIANESNRNETKESSGCTTQNQSIRVNEEYMTVNITSLMPDSNYSIIVMAYTKVGAGVQYSNTTTTIEKEPGNVTDVVGNADSATSIIVSWRAPPIRTGKTNYHIAVYDSIANKNLNQSVNVTGYEVQNWTFTGLQEYWVYHFAVYASTSKGSSSPVNSTNVTTYEASPGAVVEPTVTLYNSTNDCNATKATLGWKEPNREERNGLIVHYNIVLMSENTVTNYTMPIDDPDPYSETSHTWSRTLDTKPEQHYTVEVWAITATGLEGVKKNASFKSIACKPPSYAVDTDLIAVPETSTSSFTVKLYLDFFRNDRQGKIVSYGLIVSDTNSDVEYKIDQLPDLGKGIYPCKLNLSTLQNEVENNKNFSQYTVQNLPEDTSFYLRMYACTNGGCAASQHYGPFITKKSVSENPSNATVIAVVVVLVLFAIVAAFGGVILYRKGYHTRILATLRKHSSDQQDSVAFNHVSGDAEHILRKRPFKFSMLDEYLEEMNKDSKLGFAKEYEDIQKLSPRHSTEAALLGENKSKNRWVNILAFDHSRVKLQLLDEDDPTSDYINANFIPDLKRQRVYIATQGPLPGTIDDFWRMVWEQKVSVIVMLTKCKEGNRVKCEMYWPNELHDAKQYGDIVVRPISISNLDKFDINVFDVSMNEETRRVMHFHFQEFPDFSADVDFLTFVNFVKTVRQHSPHKMQGPIVVHCSAGVGRTGTYITVDCLQQLVESPDFDFNTEVDIFDYVLTMRDHRTLMVQVEQQYIMIHECLKILLEQRKQAEAEEGVEENLYENQAFALTRFTTPVEEAEGSNCSLTCPLLVSNDDPDPDEETDKLYENASNIPRTEL